MAGSTNLRMRTAASLAVKALVLCALLGFSEGQEGSRRALIIGIDEYLPKGAPGPAPRGLENLEYAVSDALKMRDVLVGRYGFKPEEIKLLLAPMRAGDSGIVRQLIEGMYEPPTRENILRVVDEHLIDQTGPEDTVFFYFSGHGSTVVNADSQENDLLDETIVPADAYHDVPDIRDKELRARFNRVLDRGGDLTLFFDSCESGSVARGLRRQGRATKGIGPSAAGVSDPTPEGPAPADRGALVIMSTQEGGQAKDEVFTEAFLDALRMHQADEPVESIVRRTIPLIRGIDPTTRQQPRVEGGGDGSARCPVPKLGAPAKAGEASGRGDSQVPTSKDVLAGNVPLVPLRVVAARETPSRRRPPRLPQEQRSRGRPYLRTTLLLGYVEILIKEIQKLESSFIETYVRASMAYATLKWDAASEGMAEC